MKKTILLGLMSLFALATFAQNPQSDATITIARGARYTLLAPYYDFHVDVDTTGGVVDTTKIYLPVAVQFGQKYLITNSTQDSTKPVVIYAHGTDAIDHTASGTYSLNYKAATKVTSVCLRWVGGQSGWKIIYKY